MKVKCINKYRSDYITICKIYDVIKEDKYYYKIIQDRGFEDWFYRNHFKTLSEIRNETINKLLEYEN